MEIIEITSKPPRDDTPLILLIGKFDGIHLGHQAILHKARELKNENETLAVMSFSDYPRLILREDKEYKNKLTPEKEKARVLKQFGVERIYNIAFTKEYADITAREFFLEHISRLQVNRIIIGDDFHFGKGREGSVSDLAELCESINIPVTVVPLIKQNGKVISSSDIRSLIKEGRMEAAAALLGRAYTITGEVIHGEALGRTLGFPTINLGDVDTYVFPKPGVYIGTAEIKIEGSGNEIWHVLISAGYRPTVNGEGYLIEAYLIDFTGDLYGKSVTVSFLRYLREEIKFTGLDSLIQQMEADEAQAKNILGIES